MSCVRTNFTLALSSSQHSITRYVTSKLYTSCGLCYQPWIRRQWNMRQNIAGEIVHLERPRTIQVRSTGIIGSGVGINMIVTTCVSPRVQNYTSSCFTTTHACIVVVHEIDQVVQRLLWHFVQLCWHFGPVTNKSDHCICGLCTSRYFFCIHPFSYGWLCSSNIFRACSVWSQSSRSPRVHQRSWVP